MLKKYKDYSDSDESINEQFKNYKSELNFEVKLSNGQISNAKNLQTEL